MRSSTTTRLNRRIAGSAVWGSRRGRRQSRALPRPAATESAIGEYALKRPLDLGLATMALVVSAPLWLVIAALVKLEDGGPVFYIQWRWGRGKRPFRAYKFRSMVVDADERFRETQASENDPRFTRVGRVMRATALDEMPQLINIWRGEMSWVGPRALPMNEIQVNEPDSLPDEAIPGFDARSQMRPGLTGITQIYAPRDIPRWKKFRYDCLYIRCQSLLLDLRLILTSLWVTARGNWGGRGQARRRAGLCRRGRVD